MQFHCRCKWFSCMICYILVAFECHVSLYHDFQIASCVDLCHTFLWHPKRIWTSTGRAKATHQRCGCHLGAESLHSFGAVEMIYSNKRWNNAWFNTLHGTNISHLWKIKIIFNIDFSGDMLVLGRVVFLKVSPPISISTDSMIQEKPASPSLLFS